MCVKGHNQMLLNKVNLIMDMFRAEWVEQIYLAMFCKKLCLIGCTR